MSSLLDLLEKERDLNNNIRELERLRSHELHKYDDFINREEAEAGDKYLSKLNDDIKSLGCELDRTRLAIQSYLRKSLW